MRYDSEGEAGELALSTLGKLVDSIVALRRLNHNVVLVTSGAVGVGCRELGLRKRPDSLRTKQAMAAIGQCKLMRVYDDLFRFSGQTIAQILLTRENLSQKHQYFNARNTMRELLRLGVVPIVNENDTVATEELRFGDNDRLSSLVAGMVEAKWLFLLTDVDKLYTADPRQHPGAEPIDIVHDMEQLHVRLSANEDAVSSEQEQRAESDTHAAHGPKSVGLGRHGYEDCCRAACYCGRCPCLYHARPSSRGYSGTCSGQEGLVAYRDGVLGVTRTDSRRSQTVDRSRPCPERQTLRRRRRLPSSGTP
jgi:hypothetical protein